MLILCKLSSKVIIKIKQSQVTDSHISRYSGHGINCRDHLTGVEFN